MRRRLLASLAATTAVAASLLIGSAGSATAQDATAQSASATDARGSGGVTPNAKLPDAIQVKDPNLKIVATLRGVGKQIYDCTNGAYVFREPAAGLFTLRGAPAGIHGKGPFWTHFDGSRVEGKDAVPAKPEGIGPNDVPWLKLTAVNPIPQGTGGVFTNVKIIQRIDTKGGLAPTSCTGNGMLAVNYTANYVFWA